jgi:hypothetical protein
MISDRVILGSFSGSHLLPSAFWQERPVRSTWFTGSFAA